MTDTAPTPQASNDEAPAGDGRPARLIAGAMSGTSADGVDVAVVRVAGRGVNMSAALVGHHHRPYDPPLRQSIFRLREGQPVELRELARVGRQVTLTYATAVNEAVMAAGLSGADLAAVAAHGQTLFHDPPDTVQWLDPALLAAETGRPVVSDFRRADCAAGGQGAPLVPFADYVLFRHPTRSRALLNVGGVANVTFIPAGASIEQVLAFDTGPGNCVCDWLVRAADPNGPGFDHGGEVAARGVPVFPLLQPMLQNEYFTRPPPKSTDGPAMVSLFRAAHQQVGRNFPFENLVKTACLLTATTIADAVRRFLSPFPEELIVSGGGVHNETMMALLRQPLGGTPVLRMDELGVPSAAKEAVAFALLGAATLDGEPSNVPSATGARRPVVLGSITPKP